jgi:hypothetical protein
VHNSPGPFLEGTGPNAVLCKTCSVLCVQPIVDNGGARPKDKNVNAFVLRTFHNTVFIFQGNISQVDSYINIYYII